MCSFVPAVIGGYYRRLSERAAHQELRPSAGGQAKPQPWREGRRGTPLLLLPQPAPSDLLCCFLSVSPYQSPEGRGCAGAAPLLQTQPLQTQGKDKEGEIIIINHLHLTVEEQQAERGQVPRLRTLSQPAADPGFEPRTRGLRSPTPPRHWGAERGVCAGSPAA